MKHTGKIARLGRYWQNKASRALSDGKTQQEVADLLNSELKKDKTFIKEHGENSITQQHVSSWENTGHKDWMAGYLAKEVADTLQGAENPDWLEVLADTGENLARWLIARLVVRLTELEAAEPRPPDYWQQINDIAHTLHQLRRGNHENEWLKLETKRVNIAVKSDQTRRENTSVELQAIRTLAGLSPS